MQQRTVILTVTDDAMTNKVAINSNDIRIGYAGEHMAVLLKFDLPESWVSDSNIKYQILFLTSDGQKYCTDILDTAEFSPPSAVMVEGKLYVQVVAVDPNGEIIKKTEICKCIVEPSIADGEIIANTDGVKLVELLTDDLQAAIEAAEVAIENLNDATDGADLTGLKVKVLPTSSVVFDDNGVPIKIIEKSVLSAGDIAALTDATTVFISSAVSQIQSGTFSGSSNITDIYINNLPDNINIQTGSGIPSTANIYYNNSSEFAAWSVINLAETALHAINTSVSELQIDNDQNKSDISLLQTGVSKNIQDITDTKSNYDTFATFPNQSLDIMQNHKNFVNSDGWATVNTGEITAVDNVLQVTSTNNYGIYGALTHDITVDSTKTVLIKIRAKCTAGINSVLKPVWRRNINGDYLTSANVIAGNLDDTTEQVSWTVGTEWRDMWLVAQNASTIINQIGIFVETGKTIQISHFCVYYSHDSPMTTEYYETGTITDFSATYDSNAKMNGSYTLMGNLCFVTATADINGGWADIDYPLPVAAIENTATLSTDGAASYRVSTDKNNSKLYIHRVEENAYQNDGHISFTLIYKYK